MKKIQNILLYLLFFSVNFGMWGLLEEDVFSIVKLIGIFYMVSIVLMPKGFFVMPRKLKPFYVTLVLYLVFTTIINIININPVSSKWFNMGMYQWLLMLLILVNHERMRPLSLTRAMLAFVISSFAIALFWWFGIGIDESFGNRVSIFGENPNAIGIMMSIGMVTILYNVIYNPLKMGKVRFIMLIMTIPMVILLINTGSRVALLAILCMLLAMVFIIRVRNIIIRVGYVMLVVAFIGLTLHFFAGSDMMSSRIEASIETGHISGRDVLWATIIPLIEEHPVVGVGETGYAEYMEHAYGKVESPHNVFLELMCYSGIIGTALYLFFILMVVRGAFITMRRTRNFLPFILLIPILGLMMSGQALNSKRIWCLYAYIIGTYMTFTSFNTISVKKRQTPKSADRPPLTI